MWSLVYTVESGDRGTYGLEAEQVLIRLRQNLQWVAASRDPPASRPLQSELSPTLQVEYPSICLSNFVPKLDPFFSSPDNVHVPDGRISCLCCTPIGHGL